jgi:hypothetical protein
MSRSILLVMFSTLGFAHGALTDSLDSLSNFGTPLNSTLSLLPGGQASLVSDAPSVDRLVDWQIGGTIRLDLMAEGHLSITPTNRIADGEWGIWALYFTSSGTFLNEVNILPFTSSTTTFSANLNDTAPATAETYVMRLRIREAAGDGFAFTQINATAVPESSSLLLCCVGAGLLLRRRR